MIVIDEFPNGPEPWRIDMLGRITWDRSTEYEPKIRVHLSRLKKDFGNPLFNEWLVPDSHFQCDIGINQILFAPMGRVVRNKTPDEIWRDTTQETVKIDTRNCIRTTVGGEITVGANRYSTLRSSNYRLGGHFNNLKYSNMLAFGQPEGRGKPTVVLIPTVEILRMYYFSSSKVFNRLWMGDLSDIINVEKSALLDDGVVRVSLRNGFCIDDAWYIARILSSNVMRQELANLRIQMQVEQVNRFGAQAHIHTEVGLPFEGETTIVAKGKKTKLVPVNKHENCDDRWAFLVTEILECRRAMPFKKVVVDMAIDNRPIEGTDRDELLEAFIGTAVSRERTNNGELYLTSAEQPSLKLRAAEFQDLCRRFPTLQSVEVTRSEKEVQKYKAAKPIFSACDIAAQWGTGEPGYGSTSVGSVVTRTSEQTRSVSNIKLDLFIEALKIVKSHPSVAMVTSRLAKTTSNNGDLGFFNFSKRPRLRSWHLIEERARRAVIAEIQVAGRYKYALEIERKGSDDFATMVISSSEGTQLNDGQLIGFMENTTEATGWPPISCMPWLRRQRVNHQQGSPETLAKRILATFGL